MESSLGPAVIRRPILRGDRRNREQFLHPTQFADGQDLTGASGIGWLKTTGTGELETDTTYGFLPTVQDTTVLARHPFALSSLDMWCQAKIVASDFVGGSFAAAGVAVRMNRNGDAYYLRQNSSNNLNLERVNNGAFQWGKNYARTWTVGDVLRLEAINKGGDVLLRGYLNNVLVIETSESLVSDVDAYPRLDAPYAGVISYFSDRVVGLGDWSAGTFDNRFFMGKPKDRRVVVF